MALCSGAGLRAANTTAAQACFVGKIRALMARRRVSKELWQKLQPLIPVFSP